MSGSSQPKALVAQRMRERALLVSTSAALSWDEETTMPAGGARHRADQQALLAGLAHAAVAAPEVGEWLEACDDDVDVRHWRRLHARAVRVPRALMEALAKTCTLAQEAWVAARDANDGRAFRSHLGAVVALKRDEARALQPDDPYGAMLDEHEPFVAPHAVDDVLRALVPELQRRARAFEVAPEPPWPGPVDADAQRALCLEVAAAVGFSPERGRIDTATHPSTITIGPGDVRLTTRFSAVDPLESLFCTLHELGHWLTEDAQDAERFGTPRGEVASVSLHESQARLLENHLGKSDAFLDWVFPRLQRAARPTFNGWTAAGLRRRVHGVRRSLVRVGADEVTYDLHIALRVGLERALIDGTLEVNDLPAAWSDASFELLGLRPTSDLDGWLQDGHWSAGLFGYFPTYTLGNLAAAQLVEALTRARAELGHEWARGDFAPTVQWLRAAVHQHGSDGNVFERLRAATGHALTAEAFLRHLDARYGGRGR
ncbi:MAG: carboxypeptidase M32 [Myxococcaceae bacterium]|nr:carboxypeptidase M32 [Myxococcaceae bacterium]